ncbi:phospholipase A [Dechloromonas sp. A34]|uniref:phospholipase A n=1 Tax=Dechloromonas sp. A34 TaxID=447588 RepID=UPI002248A19F|nr:phospholipase A [Dechloromonas sp. A34]
MKKRMIIPLAMLAGTCMANEPSATCAGEADDRRRLACYDRSVGRPTDVSAASPDGTRAVDSGLVTNNENRRTASAMQSAWELGDADKRRDFVIRTYHPNFLLPLHYTSNINRTPSSPTLSGGSLNPNYRPIEAKLQISLRAKVVEDLLLPGADLWVAYTQRSLWQVWDTKDSAPFRSTDYQPEMIYVIPVPEKLGALPFGWNLRMVQLGAVHQSNGQSDPLSRSWNRLYLGLGLEHGDFSLMLRTNQRLRVQDLDDNPDLVDYIGRNEMTMAWAPGLSTFGLNWRTNLNSVSRGSLQFDWTYPVFASQPSGLRWYVQLFTGYGETLLDYNHRQTSIGVGLALFQF